MNETAETKGNIPWDLTERKEILHLARRLPRRSAVRQFAFALLLERPHEAGSVQPLLKALSNPSEGRWRERAVAAWALGRARLAPPMRAEAAQSLGAVVMNSHLGLGERLSMRVLRALSRYFIFILGVSLLESIVNTSHLLGRLDDGFLWELPSSSPIPILSLITWFIVSLLWIGFLGGMSVLPFYSIALDARRNNRTRYLSVRSLGRLAQPLSVGTLAMAVMDSNVQVSKEAVSAVQEVLPTLSAEQYGLHDRDTVPRLCQLVSSEMYAPVSWLQILAALAKIGDGRAIPAIEWIIKHHGRDEIGRAAAEALPILRERQQRENDSARLVRAASAPDDAASRLLRPAQDSVDASPDLLLRPVSSSAMSDREDD